MAPIRKLTANLPTQEGRTLRVGTDVAVTDEFNAARNNTQLRVVLVADVRYHVREADLEFAWGEA